MTPVSCATFRNVCVGVPTPLSGGDTLSPMDIDALLRRLLAETDRPLALAEAELQAAKEKVAEIQAERYGLELALARQRGVPAPRRRAESVDSDNEWQPLDRTSAIERVLREAGGPLHRKEVVARLNQHGRDDALEHVSAALAHLHKKHRAVGKGGGIWVHPDHDTKREPAGDLNGHGSAEAGHEHSGTSRDGNGPAPTGPFLSHLTP